ncbi:Stk1 family PASTA domain-containing Ser/Thr kinase [Sporosarcina highlanderae]|uniref:non-specific serine/threonine protein kinase n=1 Tax=Sporosarcina highlanderae TaxID=3035916 RepID=A0ABT8JQZ8_9BACL|nr:Stk1 family PASTA domain-containing Ser/Thr kinase [Sporosarcina highlanderae]MDN4607515.1 Stk1 family PASTA domain-containing Ser/Thr kinase [Sporosarcina highlanderae]
MIGKRIGGRYEVIKGIGEGGMSKVYLAHDIILGRDVAIKVLNYDFANEQDIKKRFQREALSATSLTHPHIVNIYDVDEEGELHYFVMEYIEGQTLKKYILSNGPLPVAKAVNIMKQLVSAIANAHHNGIVHRDIKPQNILMDADGDVKITDFGIAMALHATAHTKTNSVIGTVHYLSPEQARGGMATKKSDIYSLGIVFYELLTGELPFSAETAVAIAIKHLQEETPSVRNRFPGIPQSVENVILKATAKDATYRYQSADEMYDDLLTVLSHERQNERKFTLPFDDDKTRIIPVITDPPKVANHDTTKIIEPVTPESKPPVKKKRKKWPIVLGISIAVIAIALLALFLPSLLGPKEALIPDVTGLDEAEARDLINESGFVVEGIVEDFSDEYEAGKVFRTIPEAEKKRELGTAVTLYVSKGKDTMEMTDFTTRDYDEIYNYLSGFNFKSITPEYVYSDQPEGQILGQTPAEGEHVVPEETDIVFKVSQGKKLVKLGDLTNYDKKQLDDYAETSGFDIRVVKEEYHDSIPEGNVISQDPTAGTDLPVGAKVGVVRSKGQEKKHVKVFVRTVEIPYEATTDDDEDETAEPEPQTVKIYIQDKKHSMTDPVLVFEITKDTSKVITVELEEGQRGGYKILVGTTVIEENFNYDDNVE